MIDTEKYLNSFFKGTKNPTLDAMKYFMDEYEHFEKEMKFVHIAGTNDLNRYVSSLELYKTALKYKKNNQNIYMKTLDEAIEFAMNNENDYINFITGSFYIYGDVINKII